MIKQRLTESNLTIERSSEILSEMKAIFLKSLIQVVYQSVSEDSDRLFTKMKVDVLERILVGVLQEKDIAHHKAPKIPIESKIRHVKFYETQV